MEHIIAGLYSQLGERGFKGRVVSTRRLPDLQRGIQDQYAQGLFDPAFYEECLAFYTFGPADDFPAASVIVVAVPCPQTRARFTWQGRTVALTLPPTYTGYEETFERVGNLLTESLAPEGYRISPTRLPLKLLAVRSGLGEYGRNNVCYVPGMGSFMQLAAFYSDVPCQDDGWRQPRMMDRCRTCEACLRACPTGAIAADRFLLHAERCIVFHNEMPADRPVPDWLNLTSHDCLVGCMHCQRACPENKPFLGWVEGDEEFSHEETALLLEGTSPERLPAETVARLKRLGLVDYVDVMPRNLGVVLRSMT